MSDEDNTSNNSPEKTSAEIIAFPTTRKKTSEQIRAEVNAAVTENMQRIADQERLTAALERLKNAVAEQKIAVAAWRETLGKLRETFTNLGESYQNLHDKLGDVKSQTDQIHATSLNTIEILDNSGLTSSNK